MSSTASSLTSSSLLAGVAALLAGCVAHPERASLPTGLLNDFRHWHVEAEQPEARTFLRNGILDIDTPAGITLWLTHELTGPVRIDFDATAVSAGGPNDQVSDLNVFWMARNADGTPVLTKRRGGRFAEYDDLETYYVGLGGNRNTTTRFRRYVGRTGDRPLLPQHDLSGPTALLAPNRRQRITLIADGRRIEYRRDGKPLFVYEDEAPYTRGWFALRTTFSHLRIENLSVRRP
jgi:hypothetical protein